MPRKASGTTTSTSSSSTSSKANAKGAIGIGGNGALVLNQANATTASNRGTTATRGAKRRRTSTSVNPGGTEIYGSGTIIAANPFDDDINVSPMFNNTALTTSSSNKMMVMMMSPNQPNMHMHRHHHHRRHHQPQQQQPPPPPQPRYPMHPPAGQQMYSPVPPTPQHRHQDHSLSHPHTNSHLTQNQHHQQQHHQNNHYNSNLQHNPHSQMGTPPMHVSQQQPILHQDDYHQSMHNHGNMMPSYQHQDYIATPSQPPTQHNQMIATPTSPHLMGGPAQSQSPYETMHNQMIALTPHQQASTPRLPPPPPAASHHIDQVPPYLAYCGKCQREIYHNESSIICKAGCKSFFHISCSGLTQLACELLLKESLAEWACYRCTSGTRRVPFVKYI